MIELGVQCRLVIRKFWHTFFNVPRFWVRFGVCSFFIPTRREMNVQGVSGKGSDKVQSPIRLKIWVCTMTSLVLNNKMTFNNGLGIPEHMFSLFIFSHRPIDKSWNTFTSYLYMKCKHKCTCTCYIQHNTLHIRLNWLVLVLSSILWYLKIPNDVQKWPLVKTIPLDVQWWLEMTTAELDWLSMISLI